MKKRYYKSTIPSQAFPGRPGWEFLPVGDYKQYARINEIWTKYNTYGPKGDMPLFMTIEEVVSNLKAYCREKGIDQIAVRYPEGNYEIIKIF